jgi:DNA-binding HxlR family transcriptional regulator
MSKDPAPTKVGKLAAAIEYADLRKLVEDKTKSKKIASRMYILTLGRVLDKIQRKHFRGKFGESDPKEIQEKLGVASPNSLTRYADEMTEDGLLENIGEKNRKYRLTERGKEIQKLYCVALQISGLSHIHHGVKLTDSADLLENVDEWVFDTAKSSEDAKNTMEETHEDWNFTSKVIADASQNATELEQQHSNIHALKNALQIKYDRLNPLETKFSETYWNDMQRLIGEERKIEPADVKTPGDAEKSIFPMDVSRKLQMEEYSKEEAEKIEEDLMGKTPNEKHKEVTDAWEKDNYNV